jgi:hypothetical protein
VLEAGLCLRVAPQRGGAVIAGGHRLLERVQLLLGLDEIAGVAERVFAQAHPALERRPLVVQGDSRALGEGELAAGALALAGEHAEQRRLAGPVRAGEREPVAPLDRERDALEEQRAGELLAEIGGGDDSHRPKRSAGLARGCDRRADERLGGLDDVIGVDPGSRE